MSSPNEPGQPAAPAHECEHDHEEPEGGPPPELSLAGAVVDKAIEYMASKKIDETTIASALLGGALGMLTRALEDEAVIGVLEHAIASVKAGELHDAGGSHT